MPILIDTSVWSLLLRRDEPSAPEATHLHEIVLEGVAALIGPVRQELLSGIREMKRFSILRQRLRAFVDHPIETAHFELAAEFTNHCRDKGVQGSPVDFLLCAISNLDQLPIFTTDKDFDQFAKLLPVTRYKLP